VGPPVISGEAGGPDHATAHLVCHHVTGFNARAVLELLCVLFAAQFFQIGLNVPISMKYKTDKPERHKDGSGHHHPMGVFPIEQQVEHFGHCPPPLAISPL
jgi:hypothetical protein